MNWGEGLRRLNLFFLGAVLLITIAANTDNAARLGEAIGYYLMFLVVWMLLCVVVRWVFYGFKRR